MRKKIFVIFACLFLSVYANKSQADAYRQDGLDYNIFTADSWTLAPYVYVNYALSYSSHKNQDGFQDENGKVYSMDYQYMLRNLHHGFKIGVGLTINDAWAFEISALHTRRISSMKQRYLAYEYFANIDSITTLTTIIDFDAYMKLPFSFYQNRMSVYLTGGMNVVVNSINKSYKDTSVAVPAWVAKDMTRTAFGFNGGIALRYHLTQHVYFDMEVRRLWLVTSSLIKDSWLYSLGAGISF